MNIIEFTIILSDIYEENNDYDALVLSHETLATRSLLNEHRLSIGLHTS